MPAIFVSYRRSDSNEVVGRIYDRLIHRFPRTEVFKDVDSIPLSVPFFEFISQALRKTRCVLVVIGPGYVSAATPDGKRRLDDPEDFVRLEIEAALRLQIPIVPILVSGGVMPAAEELPESLRALRTRNGQPVRPDPDFHRDMDRLLDRLCELLPAEFSRHVAAANKTRPSRGRPILRAFFLLAGAFVVLMGIVGLATAPQPDAGPSKLQAVAFVVIGLGLFSYYFILGGKRDPPDWLFLRVLSLILGSIFWLPAIAFLVENLATSAILALVAALLTSVYFVLGWLATRNSRPKAA